MRWVLSPLGWMYGQVVGIRNIAYNRGWLASTRGALPTLAIGNIDVGGTGKTPHTQYFAKLLSDLQPAILSRGYGRSTGGYRRVYRTSTAEECGDEPLLYAAMPEGFPVAVCENRVAGVEQLANETDAGMVILDDALQHRRLEADAKIALIRYGHWPWKTCYLPAGALRDHRSRLRQADAIVVSHTPHPHPAEKKETERAAIRKHLALDATIPIVFSRMVYAPLRGMVTGTADYPERALVVTGIARPEALIDFLKAQGVQPVHLAYRDHRRFTEKHLHEWQKALHEHRCTHLITTAKDAMRIQMVKGWEHLPIFIQDIAVELDTPEAISALLRKRLTDA